MPFSLIFNFNLFFVMDKNVGSALLNTAGGLISGVLNSAHQERLLKRQQAWAEKMASQQNQWNIDQWQRENEYNAPVNQMARYEAAGINPYNAVISGQIGSGSASALLSATPNNVSAPAFADVYGNPMSNFISGISSSLDNALKVLSVQKGNEDVRGAKGIADKNVAEGIKAQNDLVNESSRVAAQANLYQSQMHEFAYNSQYYALKSQGIPDIVANELAQMRSETQIMQLNAEALGYDNISKSVIAKYAEQSEKARIDLMIKQGQLTEEQAKNMEKQNKFFEKITFAQLANYAAQTANYYASADASHAAAGLSRAQTATENTLRKARGGQANETYRKQKLENDNYAPNFNNWLFNHDRESWKIFGYGKGVGDVIGTAINGGKPETSNPKVAKPRRKKSAPRIRR